MAAWKRYIGVLALGLVLTAICCIGLAQETDSIDFGGVPVGQTGTASYTFKILETSETSATVTIYPPSPPFGLQDAPSGSFTLAPGQAITFGVTFTPTVAGDYTGSFTITAQGGYPVQEKTTTVYLTGHSGSGGEAPPPGETPTTPGITIPFPLFPPTTQAPAGAVPGTTDEEGKFKLALSPTTTVAGRLTKCEDGSPLPNLPFQLAKTDAGFSLFASGYEEKDVTEFSRFSIMGLESYGLGDVCLLPEEKAEEIPCDCSRLPADKDCRKFPVQYYIEIPKGCKPIAMSLIDATNGNALWDDLVWSEEEFDSLSASGQEDVISDIIGIESGRIYSNHGEGLTNTEIIIARREGDPRKWILEVSSCCHTIPTLEVDLSCPGKKFVTTLHLGLWFDENDQYKVYGQVLVGNALKKLTIDNYNSFFEDCESSYCNIFNRRDPDSFGSNGEIVLQVPPDPSCKFDVDAFRTDLYEALKKSGCRCEIPVIDTRDGSLRGYIYTNHCTPQVVACIQEVLERYTDCKEVHWIGRQINIKTKK
jgi:hypothetical protein